MCEWPRRSRFYLPSVWSYSNTDAEGKKETISASFSHFGIWNSCSGLVALNVDGASVNMGIYRGLGNLVKEDDAPWLNLVHCFNHWDKLATKDSLPIHVLQKSTNCWENSINCIRRVRELEAEALEKTVPNPSRTNGYEMDWPQSASLEENVG